MHIIIGLVLGLALLYWWLLGHWFARIVAFLVFGVVFGILGSLAVENAGRGGADLAWLGGLAGGVAAWFVASGPRYYWRNVLGDGSR